MDTVTWRLGLLSVLLQSTGGSHVWIEPAVSADVGGDVTLPCRYVGPQNGTSQVKWVQHRPGSTNKVIILYDITYGLNVADTSLRDRLQFSSNSPVHDASVTITHLQHTDQGRYTCCYVTFPEGNQEATTTLTVLGRSSARQGPLSNGLISGVVVAACLALLLLAIIVFTFRATRGGNNRRQSTTTTDRTSCPYQAQEQDVTYADVTFRRPPGPKPDDWLEYTAVRPNNKLGSALPSSQELDCDWPTADRETVYSAVRL